MSRLFTKFGLLVLLLQVVYFYSSAQQPEEKKTVKAIYLNAPLSIDGILNESVYAESQPAKDFLQWQPYNGKPSFQPSEVHFFYDNNAVYVGAMLYDSAPDSIFNFFSQRDEFGMSDYFGVYLDPYNTGQLAYGFFVTPSGNQMDMKATKSDGDNEDGNWNAVWDSKTSITDKGWVVEMRIPYSALRFAKKQDYVWGLNMFRRIRRYNSNNSWNFIDSKKEGFIDQEGTLTGISNINPPLRLSLSPYASAYFDKNDVEHTKEFLFKGGMDLKYGLSESFTLDMMLIPDFGQIQSDDKELNLSPYELYYSEKRQFFTEGTELFERGDIFYSRRIGSEPKFDANDALSAHEAIDYNPKETQLINATKLSGRSKSGIGVGVLNAMSLPSYAILKDTISGAKRRVLVQPFTNYNVSVVDKSLRNNSYISLINSNVLMADNPFRANVTATQFQLRNKNKTYAVSGQAGFSARGDTEIETGYYASLGFAKNSGNFQYNIGQNIYSDTYDPNDLGYLQHNNEVSTDLEILYEVNEPRWIFREWEASIEWDYNRMYSPNAEIGSEFDIDAWALFKNNYSASFSFGLGTNKHNYYETRVKGRYFDEAYFYMYNAEINTDSRKPLNFFAHYGGFTQPHLAQYGNWVSSGFNIRIGKRVQFSYEFGFNAEINDYGYVDKTDDDDTIFFSRRDVKTIENIIEGSYSITRNLSLNLRTRHYWSGVLNKEFFDLQQNGSLLKSLSYNKNKDENKNAFNVDMVVRWIFAPGSEMTFAWKNSIITEDKLVRSNYWKNFKNSWKSDQVNSVSLRILYYIDYNSLRRKRR